MSSPRHLSAAAVFAAAISLASQDAAAQRLIALVGPNLATTPPAVVSTANGSCEQNARCAPAGFPLAVHPRAGGTAHDPRTGGTWITNGTVLAKVDPDTCDYQCQPIPILLPANTFVTGLAFYETRDLILMTDSDGGLITAQVRNCQLLQISRCLITTITPVRVEYTGVAIDEVSGLVFYGFVGGSIVPGGPMVAGDNVHVAHISNPCTVLCSAQLGRCTTTTQRFGDITGLGFDPCTERLFGTDGRLVASAMLVRDPAGGCQLVQQNCCEPTPPNQGVRGGIGLCVRPLGARQVGTSCANGSCGNCGQIALEMQGDPSIGNRDFGFAVVDAPNNARVFLGIGIGGCVVPGVSLPPFCGEITLPLFPNAPVFLGPLPANPTGVTPCSGTARFGISVPLDRALCGDVFSAQGIALCLQGLPIGTAMTRCTEFVISGT